MKKLICLLMTAVIMMQFCCCGTAKRDSDKLQVVCTIFPQYDFARAIAGDRAEVSMLLRPGTESHSYDPTPGDMLTVQQCDLFLYVSPYMENWAESVIATIDTSHTAVLRLDDGIDLIENSHDDHDHDDHGDHQYNGHIWTDPIIAKKMVSAIADKMSQLDPQGAEVYKQNAAAYIAELDKLDARFRRISECAIRRTALFAGRFAFSYLFERYGFDYIAAYSSCSADGEPSAAEMMRIVNAVKDDGVPCVYYEELVEPRVAKTVVSETGCDMLLLHSCHNLSLDDFNAGVTYISLMNQNADNLEKGLL